jgi:hypothetical protein
MVDVVLPDIRMTVGIVVGVATCVIMRVRVCAGWIVPGTMLDQAKDRFHQLPHGRSVDRHLLIMVTGNRVGVVEESVGVLSLAVW